MLLAAVMFVSLPVKIYATEMHNEAFSKGETGISIYLSAEDKLEFASRMDEAYAQSRMNNTAKTPTREVVDALLLRVSIASPAEQAAINEELAAYGVYKYDSPVIERPTMRTGSGDVDIATPTVYYEAWSTYWTVTCGGGWNNREYGDLFGDVGGDDGFGVGYTNVGGSYQSHVVSASAYLTDEYEENYESTSYRSDGDGSKGFGFRLQDSWIGNSYVGHKWSGLCTYDSWFGSYNGIATAYYIHTYDTTSLTGVTFGIEGRTAGISADIEFGDDSFTAFSNDKTFEVYP